MAIHDADNHAGRSLRGALVLGTVTLVAGLLVTVVRDATHQRTAAVEHARAAAELESLLAGEPHDNDVVDDVIYVRDPELLGTSASVPVYRARRAGQPVAVVLSPTAPDGYAGAIGLRVAVRADGRILGVRVLRHQETRGLGAKIDAEPQEWLQHFAGRALGDPPLERWQVRKDGGDFDQFTGATVTPRAVVHAVAASLVYFRQHRDELFAAPATMPP
jgi:electron transport complex protein RnfG